MNIDTMRNIDYYVGVPLTFIVTIIQKAIGIFITNKKYLVKNVLLIELSEMGSAILAEPAMKKLAKNISGNLHFVIFSKNKYSLQLLKIIKQDNVFTIDESSIKNLSFSTIKFFFWCRKKQIDSVIDLELFSRFTALLSIFSGAKNRIGFYAFYNEGLYRGDLLTKKVPYNSHQHIAKNFIALADATINNEEKLPAVKRVIADDEVVISKLNISKTEQNTIYNIILLHYKKFISNQHHIVLINANASDLLPQRRWQQNNYQQVINKILTYNKNIIVVLTGSVNEKASLNNLCLNVDNKRCINFAGAISFLQLPALYSISKFMLTNDSGPAHFAAVTNMHTFVIFGPETPALYGSIGSTTAIYSAMSCSPCVSAFNHRKTPCTDNLCIQIISPEQVFNIIKDKLDELA